MKMRINWLVITVWLVASLFWVGSAMAQVTLEVLNPRGEIPPAKTTVSMPPRVADLADKKIGLVANYKAGAELFLTKIEELLKKKFPTATILRFTVEMKQKEFSHIAKEIDTFVHSTGD